MEFQWISPELFANQLDWWLSKNNAENKKIDVSNWILCKLEAAYLNQQPVQERVSAAWNSLLQFILNSTATSGGSMLRLIKKIE